MFTNPETAIRDIEMVAELMRHYGHNIMGVYAEVVSPGEIGVGDQNRDRVTGAAGHSFCQEQKCHAECGRAD